MTQPTARPMRGETKRELPIWDSDALSRLLGACDGYIHAIVDIRLRISHLKYYRIEPRHIRKIAQRDAVIKPLRDLEAKLEADLRSCQAAYKKEFARAQSEKR